MEHATRPATCSVDLTGLPEAAVRAVESLVAVLREQATRLPVGLAFASRDEWAQAICQWASSHTSKGSDADWSRASIYADQDE